MVSWFLLLVVVSSTFRDIMLHLFHKSSRSWSLGKCLKHLREAKNHETIVEGQRAKRVTPTCTSICLCIPWSWECVRHTQNHTQQRTHNAQQHTHTQLHTHNHKQRHAPHPHNAHIQQCTGGDGEKGTQRQGDKGIRGQTEKWTANDMALKKVQWQTLTTKRNKNDAHARHGCWSGTGR